MAVRYTICTYFPDLMRPDSALPFAVLAASPKEIALVGVNVAGTQGLHEKHPLAAAVAEHTFLCVVPGQRFAACVDACAGLPAHRL